MLNFNTLPQIGGPSTTATSTADGRMKVGVATKKKLLKKIIKKKK